MLFSIKSDLVNDKLIVNIGENIELEGENLGKSSSSLFLNKLPS